MARRDSWESHLTAIQDISLDAEGIIRHTVKKLVADKGGEKTVIRGAAYGIVNQGLDYLSNGEMIELLSELIEQVGNISDA